MSCHAFFELVLLVREYSVITTIAGITGTVSIDANGDRNGDYSLLDMDPKTGRFQVSASLQFTATTHIIDGSDCLYN